ncbi:MAG: fatty acid desaturase [Deltaproteobacteria bacterium]|nr:fatty acid desaturase [Deltaproteobacteria bacterium]
MKNFSVAEPENKKPPSGAAVPSALNASLAAFHLLSTLFLFFLVPLFLLPVSPWWGLAALGVGALSNSFWSLIHEAVHDMLLSSRRINASAGRILGISFGSPFRVLRVSHLMHHKLNRSPLEGTELYDPSKTSRLRAGFAYFFQILGGLYLVEFLSAIFFLLPRKVLLPVKRRFEEKKTLTGMLLGILTKDEAVSEIRKDGIMALGVVVASFYCYGGHWPWLGGALGLRAFLVSFLDNVYHYRTPVDDVWYADNLWLPKWLSAILLHFNLHGVHHRNTTIPWIRLPEAFGMQAKEYDGNYFTAAARQLLGPISIAQLAGVRRDASYVKVRPS